MLHSDGSFSKGMLSAVPYRHHSSRWLWHVIVISGSDCIGMKVVASRAVDAAMRGIDRYPWWIAERSARARQEATLKKEPLEDDLEEEPEDEGDTTWRDHPEQ